MDYKVIGVRFKPAHRIYYFDPQDFEPERGSAVLVETAAGIEYGKVAVPVKIVPEEEVVLPLRKMVRMADERDQQRVAENQADAKKAFAICQEKVKQHGLGMKLVLAEYTFDRSKLIFHYTAEGRVDFRELLKDLVATFRPRIELHQIQVRDEAKLMGGIGPCGRVLCCSSWLVDFDPISIRMAKDQSLALNPAKISGLCGRLMCCLRFEMGAYEAQ